VRSTALPSWAPTVSWIISASSTDKYRKTSDGVAHRSWRPPCDPLPRAIISVRMEHSSNKEDEYQEGIDCSSLMLNSGESRGLLKPKVRWQNAKEKLVRARLTATEAKTRAIFFGWILRFTIYTPLKRLTY
jgi:hypothetical protein